MKLEHIYIYAHIQPYLKEISIVKFKKGEYITRSNQNLEDIFFILEGNVMVEYITKNGKSFLVDELPHNEFVGKISYMYDQSLFCDIVATSDVSLLKINKTTLKKLQNNAEFMNIFFYRTSRRIYCMYKKLMMKDLFKLEELLAFYILENSEDNIFKFKSMYNLCKILSISRKSLYNTINKFIENGYINKDENLITILNKKYLYELSRYVREFNEPTNNDFKFEI